MKVIVVGGGKVGYYLAQTLLEHGHHPHIIEVDKYVCTRLANDLDIPIIFGDGTTIETLELAGAYDADALVSVTGMDENNLIACQLAKKKFHVQRTVARVNNPKNAQVMKQLGVDIPISSTDNIARLLEREVDNAAIKQLISLNRGKASISEIELPQDFKYSGKKLSELRLPQQCVLASVTRDGTYIIPRGNTQIFGGDKILLIAEDEALHEVSEMFGLTNS